jgi:hypothetical protein
MRYKSLTCTIAMSVGMLTAPLALADLDEGLVAYYPFNGNANDESDNGNDGIVNGATLTQDRFGNSVSAYSFDGNDYIQFNTPIVHYTPPYSISLWLKYDAVPSINSYIISNGGAANSSQGFAFAVVGSSHVYCNQSYSEGAIFFIVGHQDSAVRTMLFAPMSFRQWHHVTGTWDGERMALYIDGQLAQTDVCEESYNYGPPDNMRIGVPGSVLEYFFSGQIDDIYIYNRALSDSEIGELYQLGSEPIKTYEDGLNEGIAICKNDPPSCGITVSDGNVAPDSSDDCMADYSPTGQLHVPCVSVSDAFGGITVYDVIMNQQTGVFTFDLDMNSIKPR